MIVRGIKVAAMITMIVAPKRPQREIYEELHMGQGVLVGYKKQADSKEMDYGALGYMESRLCQKRPMICINID
ncbi:hypothetical protein SDC9_113218 [bioreactor metagenome]|uniref:Uncharacterized protein n=1 Tax=bioreactor metagenome TaxID=1076179 RepID=A0A645BP05_9ZZZZ